MANVHGHTPVTDDVSEWLEANFPEGDVVVVHETACDLQSYGDACIGGCRIEEAS